MVETPVADEFADVVSMEESALADALQRLREERDRLKEAVKKAQESQQERAASADRARRVRERIAGLRDHARQLVDLWSLKVPPTPVADTHERITALDEETFQQIDGPLRAEEQAVAAALKRREDQDTQSVIKAQQARRRAATLRRAFDDYMILRRRLEDRAEALGLVMDGTPYEFPEYKASALGQRRHDEIARALKNATDGVMLRQTLLDGRANWKMEQMSNLAGPAQQAFDQLNQLLDATDSEDAYTTLDGQAPTWIETLRAHAQQRGVEIHKERLDDAIEDFFNKLNAGKTQLVKVFRATMEDFAETYGFDRKKWEEYQKLYNALKLQQLQNNAPPQVIDGRVTRDRLRRVLPSGNTGGQWYTVDRQFDPNDGGVAYDYHLSVAFTLEPQRAQAPLMARVLRLHVSFKRGQEDKKYWYSVNNGTVAYSNTAGGAQAAGNMRNRANALVNQMLPRLNLQ